MRTEISTNYMLEEETSNAHSLRKSSSSMETTPILISTITSEVMDYVDEYNQGYTLVGYKNVRFSNFPLVAIIKHASSRYKTR